jgi:hypothetical protein
MEKKVAIYHFTDAEDLRRPRVNEKQMERLNEFACQYGLVEHVYLDKTKKVANQEERKNLMNDIQNYDVLCLKDFYHLSKNTGTCISLMQCFVNKGIEIHSIENGSFDFGFKDVPFNKELKVCIYHSKFKESPDRTIKTQMGIFQLFIKSKTKWKIEDIFIDNIDSQNDGDQVEVLKVIANKDKYDLVMVKDFNCLHWRTAKFCKRRNELALPLYSLKEGYLPFY